MFLTLLNVMNFVDRQLLASFANWIVPDLGLTNTQFGLLTGLIFIFFYSVAGVFMGVLADRSESNSPHRCGSGAVERTDGIVGNGQGFCQSRHTASFYRRGRIHHDTDGHVAAGGPVSFQSFGLRLRRVLHGCADWCRDEFVRRRLLRAAGLARMLLCLGAALAWCWRRSCCL